VTDSGLFEGDFEEEFWVPSNKSSTNFTGAENGELINHIHVLFVEFCLSVASKMLKKSKVRPMESWLKGL
jgi:hypothetical protein